MRNQSIWGDVIRFINNLKPGDLFNKRMLMFHIYEDHGDHHNTTVATYLRVLHLNNVISIEPDASSWEHIWIKHHDIPEGISYHDMQLRAFGVKERVEPYVIDVDENGRIINITYKTIPTIAPNPLYQTASHSIFDII